SQSLSMTPAGSDSPRSHVTPETMSVRLKIVTGSNSESLVTSTIYVTHWPDSGTVSGNAGLKTLISACSTVTPIVKSSSQTHFDLVSGSKSRSPATSGSSLSPSMSQSVP